MKEVYTPEQAAEVEVRLDTQAEKEDVLRPERLRRLREQVDHLFPGDELIGIRQEIYASFDVPQFGDFHNEGMFMDSHLDLIAQNIENIRQGKFDDTVPQEVREVLARAVAAYEKYLSKYVFLHDLSKKDCLTIKYLDGSSKEMTWSEWVESLPPDVQGSPSLFRAYCKNSGVKGISYFQDKKSKKHGAEAVKILEGKEESIGIPKEVLIAIDKHEVAYSFTKINPKTYRDHLGQLSGEARDLAIAASYVDTAATLGKNGMPDLSNFLFLIESRRNFEMIIAAEAELIKNPALDQKKVQKVIIGLFNSDRRIDESADTFLARLTKECRPTEYDLAVLNTGLDAMIAVGTLTSEEKADILDLASRQDIASIGKKFGRKMGTLGPVLKASEK